MQLKEGMFIRFEGEISKIGWISSQTCEGNTTKEARFHTENGLCLIFPNDKFKASHNIIDLLELDDYVNGEKVILTQRYAKVNDKQGICLIQTDAYDIRDDEQFLIKSIVTKEQFESVSYKVN